MLLLSKGNKNIFLPLRVLAVVTSGGAEYLNMTPVTGLVGADFGTVDIREPDGTTTAVLGGAYTVVEIGDGWYDLTGLGNFTAEGEYMVICKPTAAAFEDIHATFTLQGANISGTYLQDIVRDSRGQVVSGVTITVFEASTANELAQTTTDRLGHWRVDRGLLLVPAVDIEIAGTGFATRVTYGVPV